MNILKKDKFLRNYAQSVILKNAGFTMTKKCPVCGAEFETENSRKIYCSKKCRNEKNYEKNIEYQKRYRREHMEYFREYRRKYYHEHKEKIDKNSRNYREKNRERYAEYQRRYKMNQTNSDSKYPCKGFNYYNIPDEICLNCNADYCKYYKVSE